MSKHFVEPRLRDLLDDPMTALLMARDGISRDALMRLLAAVAARRATQESGTSHRRARLSRGASCRCLFPPSES